MKSQVFGIATSSEQNYNTKSRKIDLKNQLFQIAAAMSLNSKVDLRININEISPTGQIKALPIFNYLWPAQLEFQNTKISFVRTKLENLGLRSTHSYKLSRNNGINVIISFLQNLLQRELLLSKGTVLQDNPGYFEINSKLDQSVRLIGYFQSHQFVSAEVKEWLKSELTPYRSKKFSALESELMGTSFLVCHVRLGDYLGESDFGIVSPAKFVEIVEREWLEGNFDSVVFFSDEPKKIASYLPQNLKQVTKVISEVDLDLVGEFELMRRGAGYVLSNSTFGWWGAFLSKTGNPRVVVPKPWFVTLEDPRQLNPEFWSTYNYVVDAKEVSNEILREQNS